jgi:phosphate transport system permease protein
MNSPIVARRNFVNAMFVGIALVMTGIALIWLFLILGGLVINGVSSLNADMFLKSTPPPGSTGGLQNAIIGSLMMTGVGMLIATPIGLLAGAYLSEYGRGSKLSDMIRFVNDILLSAPSIMIGLFVYTIAVAPFHHFSGWAGSIALAIIAIPILVRTTENIMRLVPDTLREAAYALGAPKWMVTIKIVQKSVYEGLLTGVLLALARVSGETAPLLFTALNNQFLSFNMSDSLSSLPVVIFQFAMSPYADWRTLAWGGAFLITASVLFLNIVSRLLIPEKGQA